MSIHARTCYSSGTSKVTLPLCWLFMNSCYDVNSTEVDVVSSAWLPPKKSHDFKVVVVCSPGTSYPLVLWQWLLFAPFCTNLQTYVFQFVLMLETGFHWFFLFSFPRRGHTFVVHVVALVVRSLPLTPLQKRNNDLCLLFALIFWFCGVFTHNFDSSLRRHLDVLRFVVFKDLRYTY